MSNRASSMARVQVLRRQQFRDALREWSDKPLAQFRRTIPPCCSLGTDEDEVLARVFAEIASEWSCHPPRRALAVLATEIAYHERQFRRLLDSVSGSNTGPLNRRTYKDTQPYKDLIDVLSSWADVVYDLMVEGAWSAIPEPSRSLEDA